MASTYTLLSSTVLDNNFTNSVTFSSIDQTYNDLWISIYTKTTLVNYRSNLSILLNGATSGYSYTYLTTSTNAASAFYGNTYPSTTNNITGVYALSNSYASYGGLELIIPNYANAYTSSIKQVWMYYVHPNAEPSATDGRQDIGIMSAQNNSTSALTSITFNTTNGYFAANSAFYLYGTKIS